MPLVSVCVPVYNVEQYIGRCIESIQNQTLQDIEIIIVNDCSPDKSMDIVEKYAKQDIRIRVISHERNKGLMWARKTGYMAATGDYITFCDSDDTLPLDAVEILYKCAIKLGVDIVSGNLGYIDTGGKQTVWKSELSYGTDKQAIYKAMLLNEFRHNLCSKLFKREVLQNFQYRTIEHFTNGEDGFLFYQVVNNIEKAYQIDNIVYYYYQNVESSSQIRMSEKGVRSVCLLNQMRVLLLEKDETLRPILRHFVTNVICDLYYASYNKDKILDKYLKEYDLNKYSSLLYIIKYNSLFNAVKCVVKRFLIRRKL